jgi:hypothetical protein
VDSLDLALKATGIVLSLLAGLALLAMFIVIAWETIAAF